MSFHMRDAYETWLIHLSHAEENDREIGKTSRTYLIYILHEFSYEKILETHQSKTKNVDLPRDLSFPFIADIVDYVFRILRISYGMFANSSQWPKILQKSPTQGFFQKKVLGRTFYGSSETAFY